MFAHDRVGGEFFGGAMFEDLAFEEQIGPVGDGERLVDVVVGDQDADAAFLEVRHDGLDVFDGNRIDAGEGFAVLTLYTKHQ